MFETKNEKLSKQNIYNDIFNFLKKFLIKYDYNINFKLLLQDSGETKKELDEICKKILHELYNITINEEDKNAKINNHEDENDLIPEDNINYLDNDWWRNNVSQTNLEELKRDSDENVLPFNVDSEIVIKKRNHWSIENDILSQLYQKSETKLVIKKNIKNKKNLKYIYDI